MAICDDVVGPDRADRVSVVGVRETGDGYSATLAGDAFLMTEIEAELAMELVH